MSKVADGEAEELVSRTGSSSVVWKHFGFKASDTTQEKVICKECRTVVLAPQSNTTNLFSHLKTHHYYVFLFVLYGDALNFGE